MDQQQETQRFSARALARLMDELSDPNALLTLHVSDGASEKVIHFTGGTIRLLSVGERSLGGLENHLLESRRLDVDTLHEVLELVRNGRMGLREALVGKHVIDDGQYEQIVNRLLRNEILDLVFWDGTDFTCSTGLPPPEILMQDDRVLIGTPSWPELTEDVGQWITEWEGLKRTLHSDRARISPTRKGLYAIEKLGGDRKRCLEACLKSRDLRAVWKTSGIDLPAVGSMVEHFRQKGWIEIQPPSGKKEPLETTIERFEEALPRAVGKDLIREKLLRLYRKAAISLGVFALVVAVALHLSGALSFAFREMAEFARQHGAEENAFGERVDPPLARFFESLAGLTGAGAEAGSYEEDGDPDGNINTSWIDESPWEDEENAPPDFLSSWTDLLEEPAGSESEDPPSEPPESGTARPRDSRRLASDRDNPRDISDANRIVSLTGSPVSDLSRKRSRIAGDESSAEESRWGIGLGEELVPSDWKPSASAEPLVSAWLISRAAKMMCGHTPPHPPRFRLAARGVFLAWSDSCNLAAVEPVTSQILFYVEGAPGHRWAIGYRGTMVCCWRPGKAGVLYNARGRTKDFTPWAFPADTEAVAIGDRMLAVRQAVRTTLYRLDGTPLHAGELLIWDEGVFIDTTLILTRSSEDARVPRGTWALRTPTLEPLWCVIERDGTLEIR